MRNLEDVNEVKLYYSTGVKIWDKQGHWLKDINGSEILSTEETCSKYWKIYTTDI